MHFSFHFRNRSKAFEKCARQISNFLSLGARVCAFCIDATALKNNKFICSARERNSDGRSSVIKMTFFAIHIHISMFLCLQWMWTSAMRLEKEHFIYYIMKCMKEGQNEPRSGDRKRPTAAPISQCSCMRHDRSAFVCETVNAIVLKLNGFSSNELIVVWLTLPWPREKVLYDVERMGARNGMGERSSAHKSQLHEDILF